MSKRGTSNNILFYPINRVLKKKEKRMKRESSTRLVVQGKQKGPDLAWGKRGSYPNSDNFESIHSILDNLFRGYGSPEKGFWGRCGSCCCCGWREIYFFSVFLGRRTAWMLGRTPPWAMVTPERSLFNSSSLRMAS